MKVSKIIATTALAVGLSTAGIAAAQADSPPEGGVWNYGLAAGVHLFSDYFNQNVSHGSTVENDWDRNFANSAANSWSMAAIGGTPWTHNKYFYHINN